MRTEITDLQNRSPIFRKFCDVHDLTEGDTYIPMAFTAWAAAQPDKVWDEAEKEFPKGRFRIWGV